MSTKTQPDTERRIGRQIETDSETKTRDSIRVQEERYHATTTIEIGNAETKRQAKQAALKYWKHEYGTRPTRIVVEQLSEPTPEPVYSVMITYNRSEKQKPPAYYTKN